MIRKYLMVFVSSIAVADATPWLGWYGGGQVGALFSSLNMNANHIALSNWFGRCDHDVQHTGGLLGAQAGFLQPWKGAWVLGIEGDFSYFLSQSLQHQCACDYDQAIYDAFGFKQRNQGSIRGRLGYQLGQTGLTYLSVGASFANLSASYTNEVTNQYQASQIKPGWTIGGGFEWMFHSQWSMRLEYLYSQYQTLTLGIPSIYGIDDPQGRGQFSLTTNLLRLGINRWLD